MIANFKLKRNDLNEAQTKMKTIIISILLFLTTFNLYAQVDKSSELFRTLKTKDSLLFNVGFNTCDISQFENLISDNFEFYHDKAGMTLSKSAFISSIKNGLCKLSYKPRRELVENSLQVFPLEKNGVLYGAIQMGTHCFYAIEKDKPEYLTDVAKFTHVWLLENGNWKLSRGLSYDHQGNETKDTINEKLFFTDRKETEKWLIKNKIPALGIGYIKDGKIEEVKVYGELEKGRPAPDNAIFTIASLTKPITAMTVLKLVDEGKWNLDEPLYKYWIDPDVANDPRLKKLTTRFILSHRSGFPNWRWENADKKLSFQSEPGTKYHYSGEGFEYLKKAIESKFHKSLDQLASELIFKPLQMKDTHFFWDDAVDETRFAKQYDKNGNLLIENKNTSANAAYGVLTTVEDYSKFLVHVMNGAGLKKKLNEEMVANQTQIKAHQYYGLGWMIDEIDGENVITHGGVDNGTQTIVFVLPKSKKGLVIFTNCGNGGDAYIPVIQKYLGKEGQGIIDVETK